MNAHRIERKIFFRSESVHDSISFLCERVATLRWGSAHNIWCDKTPCRNEKFPCTGPTRNVFGLGPYIFFVRSTNRSWNAPPTLNKEFGHQKAKI